MQKDVRCKMCVYIYVCEIHFVVFLLFFFSFFSLLLFFYGLLDLDRAAAMAQSHCDLKLLVQRSNLGRSMKKV